MIALTPNEIWALKRIDSHTWYWKLADEWEQEHKTSKGLEEVIDELENKKLIKPEAVEGAANAEYYKLTRKGWKERKEMEMTPRSRETLEKRRRTLQLKKEELEEYNRKVRER